MSATNHTQNYDLSQFVGGDIPSWLNDYNGDMSKIDAAIASVAQGSGDVAADVASLKSRMTAAEADIDAAESNISTLQSTASTQGAAITQNANNITTTNNNVSALDTRVTALENASGSSFDVTAHTGTATVSNGDSGTVMLAETDVKYALNDDKSIGMIYGGVTAQNVSSAAAGWVKYATISASDFKTLSNAFEIETGYTIVFTSGSTMSTRMSKMKFNTDGTIDLFARLGAETLSYVITTLPDTLKFIDLFSA